MSPSAQVSNDFQALLDACVDGIVVIDQDGLIRAFNGAAERLFGYSAAEALGRNVSMLMNAADAGAHDQHLKRYLQTRIAHVIGRGREVTARHRDGSLFPVYLSVGLVAGSEPARFVGFLQDLTARHQGEEQTRRLQERLWHVARFATLGEMASGIAHELNQPLTAIANYAQACERLLAKPDADIPEIRDVMKEIAGQAVRAGSIIRRLRSLASRSPGTPSSTNLNSLISELAELLKADLRAHEIQYRLELASALPAILVHPDQIQQVIVNLVRNAIESLARHEGTDRELTLRTSATATGGVELAVCDNGPGVAPEMTPRLFDPFHTSKESGTGLGLAMSRTIVRQYGGTLNYQPRPSGGACFVMYLPSCVESPA
jgi:two-component system sensor kinase FixL